MNARSLARRVARIEKAMPPPVPGCDRCRHSFVWCDVELTRVEVNGRSVSACGVCGRVLVGTFKVIRGVNPEAL